MMNEKILLSATRHFTLDHDEFGGREVEVRAAVVQYDDQTPHFAVHVIIRKGGQMTMCGACHDAATEVWPELGPLIALHLSNARTGEPLYADDNGWYWFAGANGGLGENHHGASGDTPKHTTNQCFQFLALHLRLDLGTIICYSEVLLRTANACCVGKTPHEEARKLFNDWIDAQRPRWQQEAQIAIKFIQEAKVERDDV